MIGTYCLIIRLKKNRKIKIGKKLGFINFKKGYYVYIGSAMNSLESRIKRHLSDDKKKHWHIDYLLLNKDSEIEDIILNASDKKIECSLAQFIQNNEEIIPNFGCSDCHCSSHLVYFNNFEIARNKIIKAYENLSMDYLTLKEFNHFL